MLGFDRIALSWIEPNRSALAVASESRRLAGGARPASNSASTTTTELAPLDGGGTFLDLLRELPRDLIWLELDLGWVWYAGADPVGSSSGRAAAVRWFT